MLRFELLIRAGLIVAGLIWCKEIVGRWREDVAELKMPDSTRRGVIVGMWALTAVIIAVIGVFVWGLIANVVRAF
jgi:hypothetical protein